MATVVPWYYQFKTKPALLTEMDKALVEIERLDREGDHEGAHGTEERLVLGVLVAVLARKTNHRIMTRRLIAHLERVERLNIPRWNV